MMHSYMALQGWFDGGTEHYLVAGGPVDGARIIKSKIPPVEEGGVTQCAMPDNPYIQATYRRQGDKLIYVKSTPTCIFKGGPLDGCNYPLAEIPGEDGTELLVPADAPGQVMYYRKVGRDLLYLMTGPVPKQEQEPFTQGPGLSI